MLLLIVLLLRTQLLVLIAALPAVNTAIIHSIWYESWRSLHVLTCVRIYADMSFALLNDLIEHERSDHVAIRCILLGRTILPVLSKIHMVVLNF